MEIIKHLFVHMLEIYKCVNSSKIASIYMSKQVIIALIQMLNMWHSPYSTCSTCDTHINFHVKQVAITTICMLDK